LEFGASLVLENCKLKINTMNPIEKLSQIFNNFPGIGPRQSKRFVYFLLTRDRRFLEDLSSNLLSLKKNIRVCKFCQRFYQSENSGSDFCRTCSDSDRDTHVLMIVEKDADLENIESAGVYNGKYFVLGGTVPILEKNPESKVRSGELLKLVENQVQENGLSEIILATSANPEGDSTHSYLTSLLKKFDGIKVSTLGRGLSTGTELEYSDKDTIKSALDNRG
jgi:recombination protein RecR